jgi:hypothetical protein
MVSRNSVVVLVVVSIAATASAHQAGVSRMDLEERPNGAIHGRFAFAARDVDGALDRDGHVSVEVKTDGAACSAGPVTTTPDGDGVILEEDFACTRATRSIEAIAYFLIDESVARVVTAEGAHEELLRAPHRTIVLELARKGEPPGPVRRTWVPAIAIGVVALLALAIRSILRRNDG